MGFFAGLAGGWGQGQQKYNQTMLDFEHEKARNLASMYLNLANSTNDPDLARQLYSAGTAYASYNPLDANSKKTVKGLSLDKMLDTYHQQRLAGRMQENGFQPPQQPNQPQSANSPFQYVNNQSTAPQRSAQGAPAQPVNNTPSVPPTTQASASPAAQPTAQPTDYQAAHWFNGPMMHTLSDMETGGMADPANASHDGGTGHGPYGYKDQTWKEAAIKYAKETGADPNWIIAHQKDPATADLITNWRLNQMAKNGVSTPEEAFAYWNGGQGGLDTYRRGGNIVLPNGANLQQYVAKAEGIYGKYASQVQQEHQQQAAQPTPVSQDNSVQSVSAPLPQAGGQPSTPQVATQNPNQLAALPPSTPTDRLSWNSTDWVNNLIGNMPKPEYNDLGRYTPQYLAKQKLYEELMPKIAPMSMMMGMVGNGGMDNLTPGQAERMNTFAMMSGGHRMFNIGSATALIDTPSGPQYQQLKTLNGKWFTPDDQDVTAQVKAGHVKIPSVRWQDANGYSYETPYYGALASGPGGTTENTAGVPSTPPVTSGQGTRQAQGAQVPFEHLSQAAQGILRNPAAYNPENPHFLQAFAELKDAGYNINDEAAKKFIPEIATYRDGLDQARNVLNMVNQPQYQKLVGPITGRAIEALNKAGSASLIDTAFGRGGLKDKLADWFNGKTPDDPTNVDIIRQAVTKQARSEGYNSQDADKIAGDAAELITALRWLNASELNALMHGGSRGFATMWGNLAPSMANIHQDASMIKRHIKALTDPTLDRWRTRLDTIYNGNVPPEILTQDERELAGYFGRDLTKPQTSKSSGKDNNSSGGPIPGKPRKSLAELMNEE